MGAALEAAIRSVGFALVSALVLAPALAVAQAPPATITQAPPGAAPSGPPQAIPARTARPTLIPEPGDPTNVDEVVLPEKPVVILSGASTWDDGLKTLRAAFGQIETELAKAGIAPAGRPIAVFTQTTDDSFRFDAMVPIAALPSPAPALPAPALPAEMRLGTTPSGKAFRFVHKGPYDDIDSTYETITTYLEVKDLVAKDTFIEEFVTDIADPADPGHEVNIYVQPK